MRGLSFTSCSGVVSAATTFPNRLLRKHSHPMGEGFDGRRAFSDLVSHAPIESGLQPRLHGFGMQQHLVVGEADNLETEPAESIRPRFIEIDSLVMMLPVDLDDHVGLEAQEIDHVVIDRYLSTELVAMKTPVAEQRPEFALRLRHRPAQVPGKAALRKHAGEWHGSVVPATGAFA